MPEPIELGMESENCTTLITNLLDEAAAEGASDSESSDDDKATEVVKQWMEDAGHSPQRVKSMAELVARFLDLAESGLNFLEMASVDVASLRRYVQQMGVLCDWRAAWAKTEYRAAISRIIMVCCYL